MQMEGMESQKIKRVFANVKTAGIRVSNRNVLGFVALSGLRIYGHS